MVLAAAWLSPLAAAFELAGSPPPCVVEVDGLGFVASQVDVLSPSHLSRWRASDIIPLDFSVDLDPKELSFAKGILLCASFDGRPPP